jgi:hypothetical protein
MFHSNPSKKRRGSKRMKRKKAGWHHEPSMSTPADNNVSWTPP